MSKMSTSEAFSFLAGGLRTGHLGTTRADGRAHVKPVWFIVDGTPDAFTLLFNTGVNTVAGRNLARDPRLSLSVDDPTPPFSFVLVEGTAELIDDLAQVRPSATEIAARYVGRDRADAFGARNGVPGELLVRVSVNRLIGEADLTD
jgi:PPOX class probable F420-dependent enzyme